MSENIEVKAPKVFISYSWSSEQHENWVLELANDLVESGIHVIIDKWDLKEGADKYAFMEKMVTDKNINKVVIISDKLYAEKADDRKGGVGSETQIISNEVYNQLDSTSQEQKFVAVITEKDVDGKVYLPTFLKSRMFIDFTKEEDYASNLEKLIRWIFDKPLLKRPAIGKPPAFIHEDAKINLGTSTRSKLVNNSLSRDKDIAIGHYSDYLEYFADQMELFRIAEVPEGKFLDDIVIESIDEFLRYRDEFIDLFIKVVKQYSTSDIYDHVHNFCERILPYAYWPAGVQTWNTQFADNYKFILNELFLYIVAILIKYNRFDIANNFIEQGYYVSPGSPEIESGLESYRIFRGYLETLSIRNDRLQLRRISLMSDLFEKRAKRKDVTFTDIMQADFVLFLRSDMFDDTKYFNRWYPYTLLYASFREAKFEKFLRSESKSFFDKFKVVLGVHDVDTFKKHIEKYDNGELKAPKWEFESVNPRYLANTGLLCSKQ